MPNHTVQDLNWATPGGISVSLTFWEKVATTNWGQYVSEIERQAIQKAVTLVGKPGQALEVGCEGGRWSKMLADQGWILTCVDVNPEVLALCQQKIPAAKCILSSPTDRSLPCATQSSSLVVCIEVAPVIQSNWFLAEAYRVLVPGGVLVGTFWNFLSWRGILSRMRHLVTRRSGDAEYYRRCYFLWRPNLAKNGLRLFSEKGFYWGPFGRASNSRLIPSFARLERRLQLSRFPAISPQIAFIAQKGTD
jgi:SAM-dependent methyltransferase